MDLIVDTDVVEAAVNYVKYGLHPGSCCMRILHGNLEAAALACHPVALPYIPATYQAVRALVPPEARDSMLAINHWIAHHGLAGTPD
jgi:hypothetical protein